MYHSLAQQTFKRFHGLLEWALFEQVDLRELATQARTHVQIIIYEFVMLT